MAAENDPPHGDSPAKPRQTGAWVGGVVSCMLLLLVATFLTVDPNLWNGGAISPTASQLQTQKEEQSVAPVTNCERDDMQRTNCKIGEIVNALNSFWTTYLPQQGFRYAQPKAVFFNHEIMTDCGRIRSTSGTFYCHLNETLYYDTSFFNRLGKIADDGEAAVARQYAVAQSFGHHVQNLTGDLDHARKESRSKDEEDKNDKQEADNLGPKHLELQADCFVGLWSRARQKQSASAPSTHSEAITTRNVDKALSSLETASNERHEAHERGNTNIWETIQNPPEQRKRWYTTGYNKDDYSRCNAFKNRQP